MNSSSDPDRIAGALAIAALDVADDPFPLALVVVATAGALDRKLEVLAGCPMEQCLAGGLRDFPPGCREIELEGLGQRGQHGFPEIAGRLAPGQDDPFENGDAGIAEDQAGVDLPPGAKSMAVGTDPEGAVEGELARLKIGQRESANGAGKPF